MFQCKAGIIWSLGINMALPSSVLYPRPTSKSKTWDIMCYSYILSLRVLVSTFFFKIFRYNSRTTVRTLPKLPCLFSSSLIRETASLELWHLKSSSLRIRIWTNGSMHIKFQRHFVRLRRQQIDRDREDKSYWKWRWEMFRWKLL